MSLNWSYIKSNEGWYSLEGTQQIFFKSEKGVVRVFIPENQFFEIANSVCWADSKFEQVEDTI